MISGVRQPSEQVPRHPAPKKLCSKSPPISIRWPKPMPATGPVPRDCGWLRRGYAARIVDEGGSDVPDGTSGELWIRPPARELIMRGYNGLPEKTASAMVEGLHDRMVANRRRLKSRTAAEAGRADLLA